MKPLTIFWFRRDLRLNDNCGLFHALNGQFPVLPLFIFDKSILDQLDDTDDARVNFIYKNIVALDSELRKINSGILVKHGQPLDIFTQLIKDKNVGAVYTNHDYEPYAISRDNQVRELFEKNDIVFKTFKDQVIFEKDEILNQQGKPYIVYTPYRRNWQESLRSEDVTPFPSETKLKNLYTKTIEAMPDLTDFGFKQSHQEFPSAEIPEAIIDEYDKTRNFPGITGTSRLGIHLRFGTLSIRRLVQLALELNETWLSELIWREFFMMILYHFPHVVEKSFRSKYDQITWRNDKHEFELWCQGKTGYPIVDAGMRELNQTGFMHNRVRMITASFLTKHLLIDWRWGERYFARKLLDYELASNNGNWQWVAGCGCDAAPYFRIFNPTTQMEKFDAKRTYINTWVPDLEQANYPKPIVEHKYARERALSTYALVVK
jgi:deoxyribodipyrimidine photo-lyase